MIDILRLTKMKIVFGYLYLIGTFIKLTHLNVIYYFIFVSLFI